MTEYYQAVFEVDELFKNLVDRNNGERAACLAELEAMLMHVKELTLDQFHQKCDDDNWLKVAADNAALTSIFMRLAYCAY